MNTFVKNILIMAKRRELKKDISYLTSQVVEDCLLYIEFNTKANQKVVAEIINKIILKQNEVLAEINKPTSKINAKEVKANYKKIIFTFLDTVNSCYEELSKLPRD